MLDNCCANTQVHTDFCFVVSLKLMVLAEQKRLTLSTFTDSILPMAVWSCSIFKDNLRR